MPTPSTDSPLGSHAADLAELRAAQDLLEKAEAKLARVQALLDQGYGKILHHELAEALRDRD